MLKRLQKEKFEYRLQAQKTLKEVNHNGHNGHHTYSNHPDSRNSIFSCWEKISWTCPSLPWTTRRQVMRSNQDIEL